MRIARTVVFLLGMSFLVGAGAAPVEAGPPGAALVLKNGNIYTVAPDLGRVEALAITDGKIVAAGTDESIEPWVGERTRVINLEGKFVMPGFNDAHVHLVSGGFRRLQVDLEGTRSLAEFKQRIRRALVNYRPGEWVTGSGWDESLWPSNRVPTRQDLDAVSTDYPMMFSRVDGHSVVVNSRALEEAGITAETEAPYGGAIVPNAEGKPTGWLKEAAVDLVSRHIPEPGFDQRRRAVALALEDAGRHGVTSLQDDSLREGSWDNFRAMQGLKEDGKLTARITEWLPFTESVKRLREMREEGGTTDPWLRTGALKFISDGSGGSRSAAMLEPFAEDPDNRGLLLMPPDELKEMVIERDAAGFQLAIHAIGDRANRVVLDAFKAARQINGRKDTRHRIEHAQFVHPDDVPRFAELGVIASVQACHLLSDLRWAPTILGPERYAEAYRWRSLQASGARLAFGTDYPVEPLNPMRNLYVAVTREFEGGGPEGGWVPAEKLTIEDAIRAYTLGSAYAEFEEHRKGSLKPGKFADLVVLSNDVTQVPPQEILETEVLLTMVGGRIVYEK